MIKDSLNSILDNIKERTTNPFLGTLIVVWVVHNWNLVYSMFYFDSAFKLQDRLSYINKYFNNKPFIWNLLIVVGITIVVLLFTYLMLSISRLITDTHERIVLPLISKWTDENSVVSKEKYTALERVVNQLGARVEEERLAKVAAQTERDAIDKRLTNQVKASLETDITDKGDPSILKVDRKQFNSANIEDEDDKRIISSLSSQGSQRVNKTLIQILNDSFIEKDNPVISILLKEQVVRASRTSIQGNSYKLTERGQRFLPKWNKHIGEASP